MNDPINFTDSLGLQTDKSMYDPESGPGVRYYRDMGNAREQGERNLNTFCEVSATAASFGIGLDVALSGHPELGALLFENAKSLIYKEPITLPGPFPVEIINVPEAK